MNTLNNQRKDEKAREIVREIAAKYVQLESNHASMITVTDVTMGDQGHNATIYFTVLPQEKEAVVADFLKRKRKDFQEYARNHSRLGRMPIFDFEPDRGEKHRQKIDELMR